MKKFLLFAVAMLGLVACNKNNADEPNAPKKQIVLTATVDNNGSANGPHRVAPKNPTAETVHFTWEEGDVVYLVAADESEIQEFTLVPGSISPDGETAEFTGIALADMSYYYAMYGGQSDYRIFFSNADYEINYIEDSFKPAIMGFGNEDGFVLDQFGTVIKLQLKGDVKLGQIKYLFDVVPVVERVASGTIMNFADGLQLSSTAKSVYLPVWKSEEYTSFCFYDMEGTLIMEKPIHHDFGHEAGYIVTMPELEVKDPAPPAGLVAVDLGLPSGIKWASFNVGATAPEGYGDYFAWGETAPKTEYSWGTYFDTNDDGNTFTKYNCDGGKTVLDPEDDAANVNWGGSWRMPTESEFEELVNNCTWSWTTLNGVNGYQVEGSNGNSIFLPAAGFYRESLFNEGGTYGYYWSSSLEFGPGGISKILYLPDYDQYVGTQDRNYGLPVRAVCD